jgi:hypothetical protein
MYAPHIAVGPEGRVAPGTTRLSLLMPPGTYTVKLVVDGREHTQPLTVRKDPNSGGSEAEIAEQMRLLVAIRDDMNRAAEAVGRIESARVQLDALQRQVADADVRRAAAALGEKLVALEMELVDLRLTGAGQDGVRFGSKLIGKLGYLATGLAGGDFRPTDQQVEVQRLLAGQLVAHLAALDALVTGDLAALNRLLASRNIPHIAAGR